MSRALPILTDPNLERPAPADDGAGLGTLSTSRGNLPLEALDVRARIEGLLVRVDLDQVFVNATGEVLEATYIFPLPDRAAVTAFRMEVGGRVIEGALEERAKARKEYEKAIRDGHRAAIAEEERSGVFTIVASGPVRNEARRHGTRARRVARVGTGEAIGAVRDRRRPVERAGAGRGLVDRERDR